MHARATYVGPYAGPFRRLHRKRFITTLLIPQHPVPVLKRGTFLCCSEGWFMANGHLQDPA